MSTTDLQKLFAAAREDAPSDAVRDAVWGRIAAATAAAPAAAAVKAGSTKLVVLGAVIGAAGIGSITALVMTASPAGAPATTSGALDTPSAVTATPVLERPEASSQGERLDLPPAAASAAEPLPAVAPAPPAADSASSLAEEARLLTEARLALHRGAPDRALALLRATRRLPERVLEAEALELEARALHALGRTDEAAAIEGTLRSRFPNHAPAR